MQSALPRSSGLTHQPARSLPESIPGRIAIAFAATLFVAACAHVSIPLPFTPVPLTLQNFGRVLLVGLFAGPAQTAFSAMVLYLAEGAMGLPVFNPMRRWEWYSSLAPQAVICCLTLSSRQLQDGPSVRSLRSVYARAAVAGTLATSILFVCMARCGSLGYFISAPPAFGRCRSLLFLPGELVKIAAAAGLAASIQHWRRA